MYRSSSIKTLHFLGAKSLRFEAFAALPVHKGQWLFQKNRMAAANIGQERVGSSSALAEISTEELSTPSAPRKMFPSFQAGYTAEGVGHCGHPELGFLLQSKQVTPRACCRVQGTTGDL